MFHCDEVRVRIVQRLCHGCRWRGGRNARRQEWREPCSPVVRDPDKPDQPQSNLGTCLSWTCSVASCGSERCEHAGCASGRANTSLKDHTARCGYLGDFQTTLLRWSNRTIGNVGLNILCFSHGIAPSFRENTLVFAVSCPVCGSRT